MRSVLLLLLLATALPALAQPARPGHGAVGAMPDHGAAARTGGASPTAPAGHPPEHAAAPAEGAGTPEPMQRMNRDMAAAPMTGDPDRDFVAMMLPHHQGAIDMARAYLRDGRDPAMRRLARRILADQAREIREMHDWQARHPAPR